MAIEFKKTNYAGHFPEIWRGECKMLPAGFKPKQNFPIGTVIHRGTLIEVDFDTMSAAVVKTAKVINGGTETAPRVAKGHLFTVGDLVTKAKDGATTVTVKSIDTSNVSYDVITFNKAYTGIKADDVIVETESGATNDVKSKYTPNMVVGATLDIDGKGLPTIDAAYEAVVLYQSLMFPVCEEWLQGCCLKNNQNILFIKQ